MARVAHCFLSMERHWRIALARNPMPIQIRCGPSSFPSRLEEPAGTWHFRVRSSLLAILWRDGVRIFQQPCLVSRGVSGVLQVDPEDPADDLSQDLYEV